MSGFRRVVAGRLSALSRAVGALPAQVASAAEARCAIIGLGCPEAVTQMSEIASHSIIDGKIHRFRGQIVMIDRDIAAFYGVPTSVLNRAVRRVIDRFPEEFMFQLNGDETAAVESSASAGTKRARPVPPARRPYAFTEEGIHAMSYFLKSQRARRVSVELIRLFHSMRNIVDDYQSLYSTVQQMKKRQEQDSKRLWEVARSIHQLEEFREEVAERILRSTREGWSNDRSRERLDMMRYELDQMDRHALKHRDLFYLLLTIFGALLTALILLPR